LFGSDDLAAPVVKALNKIIFAFSALAMSIPYKEALREAAEKSVAISIVFM
jgi:hypothetical protein